MNAKKLLFNITLVILLVFAGFRVGVLEGRAAEINIADVNISGQWTGYLTTSGGEKVFMTWDISQKLSRISGDINVLGRRYPYNFDGTTEVDAATNVVIVKVEGRVAKYTLQLEGNGDLLNGKMTAGYYPGDRVTLNRQLK